MIQFEFPREYVVLINYLNIPLELFFFLEITKSYESGVYQSESPRIRSSRGTWHRNYFLSSTSFQITSQLKSAVQCPFGKRNDYAVEMNMHSL